MASNQKNTQPIGGNTTYASTASSVVLFLVTFGMFAGGMFLMGRSFAVEGYELLLFGGGLLLSSLGVFVVFHVIRMLDRG